MRFEWVTKLTEAQCDALKDFYRILPIVHIEQFPGWNIISQENTPVRYCIASNANIIQGYTMVYEYKRIEARIIFGPLAKSIDTSIEIILEVIRYYKKKRFLSLQVLLGMEVGTDATLLQYILYTKKRFKWVIDKSNKATLILNLNGKTEEQLLKHFSENHRRAIKKAEKYNLICRKISAIDEVMKFSEGYDKMFSRRGFKFSSEKSLKCFVSIFEWLKKGGRGFFMGVFENDQMIGGVLVLFRNYRAEYYRGFTLLDERKIPIGHLAFYEAMKWVKQEGITYFDFGGYNILVDEKDQVYQINKFKKGFHGEYFFYPPIMYFDLMPMGVTIVSFLKRLKKIMQKRPF